MRYSNTDITSALYWDTEIKILSELYIDIFKYGYYKNFILGYLNTDIIRTLYWDTQIHMSGFPQLGQKFACNLKIAILLSLSIFIL